MRISMFRVFTVMVVALSLIILGPLLAFSQTISTDRIAGSDRIATAIAVSEHGWNQADTVILNENNNFPDAIAATPLAVKLNAPILLTKGGSLDSRVIAELQRLEAKHVILLGGKTRLKTNIESKLTELNFTWERIGGKDRYETSVAIAKKISKEVTSVIIANGEKFPDALSAASFAGIEQMPILLTTKTKVPSPVKEYLNTLSPEEVIVVGGTNVVPEEILKAAGINEKVRLGGVDRFETNENVYDYTKSSFGSTHTVLASGMNYPDAIVGAVLAAKYKAPLLLTSKNNLPSVAKEILKPGVKTIASFQSHLFLILGGTKVISENIERLINENTTSLKEAAQSVPEIPIPDETFNSDETSNKETPPQEKPSASEVKTLRATTKPAQSSVSRGSTIKALQGLTIIVDPGHGGANPGAVGPAGTKEKDNNFAISQYLVQELKAAGANVVLTRTGDYSPANNSGSYDLTKDLQARVNIANANKAHLFVSIHNDSLNATSQGSSTYYSSSNPQSYHSKIIADHILRELTGSLNTRNGGVIDKNLYVLRKNTMPSVLVEVAFISNPKEEALLSNTDFRKKAAKSIAAGIIKYYKK